MVLDYLEKKLETQNIATFANKAFFLIEEMLFFFLYDEPGMFWEIISLKFTLKQVSTSKLLALTFKYNFTF